MVVGSGLITPQHITQEAIRHIQAADIVFHIVPDPLGVEYLSSLNTNLHSLADCYHQTDNRKDTYQMMVDRIIRSVKQEKYVVAIFYGHPGVFVTPSFDCIEILQNEGFKAKMLPGISAEHCLYADLLFDPGTLGSQAYEATYFLVYKISINCTSPLIIWQLGVVGDTSFSTDLKPSSNGMAMLQDKLLQYYPETHKVFIYEAATLPGFKPRIDQTNLSDLSKMKVTEISTLYVPPFGKQEVDLEFTQKWKLH